MTCGVEKSFRVSYHTSSAFCVKGLRSKVSASALSPAVRMVASVLSISVLEVIEVVRGFLWPSEFWPVGAHAIPERSLEVHVGIALRLALVAEGHNVFLGLAVRPLVL